MSGKVNKEQYSKPTYKSGGRKKYRHVKPHPASTKSSKAHTAKLVPTSGKGGRLVPKQPIGAKRAKVSSK